MTVASETNKVTYAGDASTTSFSTSFTFAEDSEVKVTLVDSTSGAETAFTKGTQYTLTGANTGAAGTVTIVTSPTDYTPASGKKLVIQLAPDFLQQTDLPRGGTVSPADTLEPMHDSRVRQMLRLKDELDRAIKVPIDETTAFTLPNVTSRANRTLAFDGSGQVTPGPTITNVTNAETFATAASNSATASASSAAASASSASSAASAATTALAAKITISTSNPTGGSDGDIWFKVSS
jgi:hypothetical protein